MHRQTESSRPGVLMLAGARLRRICLNPHAPRTVNRSFRYIKAIFSENALENETNRWFLRTSWTAIRRHRAVDAQQTENDVGFAVAVNSVGARQHATGMRRATGQQKATRRRAIHTGATDDRRAARDKAAMSTEISDKSRHCLSASIPYSRSSCFFPA